MKLKLKKTSMFEFLIWMIWMNDILLRYIRAAIMRIPIIGEFPDYVIMIFYICIIIVVFYTKQIKIQIKDLLFLLVILGIFFIDALLRGYDNEYLYKYYLDFPLKTLSLYIVGVSLTSHRNEDDIIRHLYYISLVTVPISFMYQIIFAGGMSETFSKFQGDMSLAYNLLPHCCLIAYFAKKNSNIINIMSTIFAVFYLFSLGSRGPILILLMLIVFLILSGKSIEKRICYTLSIIGLFVVFIKSSYYDKVVLWMYDLTQNLGLSVRIFDKLLVEKQILNSSGRDVLATNLFESVKNNLFIGTGICSDRMIVGVYAHNIVLELWVEFGIIFGTLIFVGLVFVLIRGYLSSIKNYEKGFILALFFSSFLKLFLSGSYFDEKFLFLLLGVSVGSIRKRFIER